MPGSLFERLFGCPHRRLTRPITPVSKPGVPSGETYVVCLDCGKQFAYDWDRMRMGNAIGPSKDSGVLHHDMPALPGTKLKYALIGSALPLGVLLGRAIVRKRRNNRADVAASGAASPTAESLGTNERLDENIMLPHGGPGARFSARELIAHLRQSGRDYIIQGQVDCSLADHPKPSSLDYWLREHFARNKDVKQATNEVVERLAATGYFEEVSNLVCPDSGHESKGIRVARRA